MGPEYDDFLVHPTFLHFSAFFPLTPAFALLYICSVHTLLSISFFHCPHFYFYFTDNCLFLAFKSFLPFKSAFFHSFYKFYPSFKDMCFFFFSDIFVFQILPFLSSFINFFIFLFFFFCLLLWNSFFSQIFAFSLFFTHIYAFSPFSVCFFLEIAYFVIVHTIHIIFALNIAFYAYFCFI